MQLRHIANRGQETPVASAHSISATPQRPVSPPVPAAPVGGPDPRLILPSIGEVVYEWDLGTDRLTWGPNLSETLGDVAQGELGMGAAFGERVSPESVATRYGAVMQSGRDGRRRRRSLSDRLWTDPPARIGSGAGGVGRGHRPLVRRRGRPTSLRPWRGPRRDGAP